MVENSIRISTSKWKEPCRVQAAVKVERTLFQSPSRRLNCKSTFHEMLAIIFQLLANVFYFCSDRKHHLTLNYCAMFTFRLPTGSHNLLRDKVGGVRGIQPPHKQKEKSLHSLKKKLPSYEMNVLIEFCKACIHKKENSQHLR